MISIFDNFTKNGNYLQNLNPDEFLSSIMKDDKAVVIDVRTPSENAEIRIPNSKLIDIYNPEFDSKINLLDRSKNYYLYCRSGSRSLSAGRRMYDMGFKNVFNLKNGIINWNGPVESEY